MRRCRTKRISVRGRRVLIATLLVALATLLSAAVGSLPVARAKPLATLYGADPAAVQAAVNAAGWPQAGRVWCGLAAMTAVIDFHATPTLSQQNVADYLNSDKARSAWGTPAPNPAIAWGPGFPADISRDVGTDPRSMASGEAALSGHGYHQLVDRGSAQDATLHLIQDVVRSKEPINVIVFKGGHSVLVSGVLATGNPLTNPGSVTALEVWDPGFGIPHGNIQFSQMAIVPLSDWYTNQYYWPAPYQANLHGAIAEDPDPAVGPYTYDPSSGRDAHLWDGHFVYIRPDAADDTTSGVSADWAFNQQGALIRGARGEMPSSYGGPLISMSNDTPIPNVAATATAAAQHSQPTPTPSTTSSTDTSPSWYQTVCTASWCRKLASLPWWTFAAIPLLFGGLLLVAAIRAERRARRARRRHAATPRYRTRYPADQSGAEAHAPARQWTPPQNRLP